MLGRVVGSFASTPGRRSGTWGAPLLHGNGARPEGCGPSPGVDGDHCHGMRAQCERRRRIEELVARVEVSAVAICRYDIGACGSQCRRADGDSVDIHRDVAQRCAILRIGDPAANLQRVGLTHRRGGSTAVDGLVEVAKGRTGAGSGRDRDGARPEGCRPAPRSRWRPLSRDAHCPMRATMQDKEELVAKSS